VTGNIVKVLVIFIAAIGYLNTSLAQCEEINVPDAIVFSVDYCFGEEIPPLEAIVPNGNYAVYWYDAPVEGNMVFIGQGFTPDSVGIYYAEVVETNTDCISEHRSAAALSVFPSLSYSITQISCSADYETYSIVFEVVGGSETPIFVYEGGSLLESLGNDRYMVSDIPANVAATIFIEDFHCNSGAITLPMKNCDCEMDMVPNAMTVSDSWSCYGENPTTISVAMPMENVTVQWFDIPSGGMALHMGMEFTPDEYGIYYAELLNDNGCVSLNRRLVQANQNEQLIINEMNKFCDAMGDTYSVNIEVGGGIGFGYVLESNVGTMEKINEWEYWVGNIPIEENAELSVLDNMACSSERYVIDAPTCVSSDNGMPMYVENEFEIMTANSILPPTAFSPNGDGVNDEWKVLGRNIVAVETIVFNRWGEKVFYSKNMNECWNGTFNGKMAAVGVYPAVIKVLFEDGKERLYKTSISLIR